MEVATVYNRGGAIIATGRTGTLWNRTNSFKLGSWDESSIMDGDNRLLGAFSDDGSVYDTEQNLVGSFDGENLIVEGQLIARCVGPDGSKALAIYSMHAGVLGDAVDA